MRSVFRHFSIVFMALLVLYSTTGVAIYHHICGCPAPAVAAAPLPAASHSCCSDEDHDACDAAHHDRCRNEVTYLKPHITFVMPVQEQKVSEVALEMPDFRMPDAGSRIPLNLHETPYVCDFLIPPRAGGSLVIFFHSLKIPFPEAIA